MFVDDVKIDSSELWKSTKTGPLRAFNGMKTTRMDIFKRSSPLPVADWTCCFCCFWVEKKERLDFEKNKMKNSNLIQAVTLFGGAHLHFKQQQHRAVVRGGMMSEWRHETKRLMIHRCLPNYSICLALPNKQRKEWRKWIGVWSALWMSLTNRLKRFRKETNEVLGGLS